MWWAIAKYALDRNNSPSWNRVKQIMSIWNAGQGNSAKQTTYQGAVTNDGMYGSYGGN